MKLIKLSVFLLLFACESRNVKLSGLNDLLVGVQHIVLYENGEFYLELGAGGKSGNYKIAQDTIYLSYFDGQDNFPEQILITDDYFITIPSTNNSYPIKIKRHRK